MSPRAAWRLESLGFPEVIDYVPGKQAWYEANQPREGTSTEETWLGDVADETVPTCRLDERIGDILGRVRADGRETCVVVNTERIVLGLLRKKALGSAADRRAEEVMSSGPKTFRPNLRLEDLLESMRKRDIQTNSLVTTGEGRLLGIISRADAEVTLAHEETAS
jgi:CBS domain-containing protein